MTNYIFKIACHDKNTQVPKIVNAVLNSVPFQLDVFKNPAEFSSNVTNRKYDLLIINRLNSKITPVDVRKSQLVNPESSIIIIDKDYNLLEEWLDLREIKFLTEDEIVHKLPVFLGEIYSKSNEKLLNGFDYFDLIKNSLKMVDKIVILADETGNIIFLNQQAEKILGVENQDYLGQSLFDYIADGSKIWSFIYERCLLHNENLSGYKITFRDALNVETQGMISAKRLSESQKFVMIESDSDTINSKSDSVSDQYELLDKFADSIANDLLNPVNIISGRIQMLRDNLNNDKKYSKSFESLEKQISRIQDVTSKMLTFARLKQDSVPQKIDLNHILKKVLIDPLIKSHLDKTGLILSSALVEPVPIIKGLIGHFDALFRTILELSFDCLGNKGAILVETEHLINYLNQEWIGFTVTLDYYESVFTKKENLHTFLGTDYSLSRSVTIESTIVDHIIRHYHGNYQLRREGQTKETISLLFPVPESRH